MGYSQNGKACRFFNLIIESSHAIYFEDLTIKEASSHKLVENLSKELVSQGLGEENTNEEVSASKRKTFKRKQPPTPTLRKSKRKNIEKDFGLDMMLCTVNEDLKSFSVVMSRQDSH